MCVCEADIYCDICDVLDDICCKIYFQLLSKSKEPCRLHTERRNPTNTTNVLLRKRHDI